MTKHNAKNERIKRAYFAYLKEACRRNDASVDGVAKALSRFEESTGHRDLGRFHREQAVAFKRTLNKQANARTGERLSRATVHTTLTALRSFFIWLAGQPGYKRLISYSDADYFNLSEKEVRIAQAVRDKPFPTLEQYQSALAAMPCGTDIELRDRALVALALLTGARDGALISLKLRNVDLANSRIDQDARDVKTKFSKTFSTWFLPVGSEALTIFTDWVTHLRQDLLWGGADPLFPSTLMARRPAGGFQAVGLTREHWTTASAVRRIYRDAYQRVGLPYFKPHAVRDTLAQFGERICRTPEEVKAWSQNFGHSKPMTTFLNYGQVASHRQAELIKSMIDRKVNAAETVEERLARLEALLGK